MVQPEWKLADDRKSVTITFPSTPPVALVLDVAAVEDLLNNLGEFRAAMEPSVQSDQQLGQKVAAIPDPRWATEPELMLGASVLHLRDPRFGWLHFVLPREEARNLGSLLLHQADSQPPEPTPGTTN